MDEEQKQDWEAVAPTDPLLKKPKRKNLSSIQMFRERLSREGRLGAYKLLIHKIATEADVDMFEAARRARKEMPDGYVSAKWERKRHLEYLRGCEALVRAKFAAEVEVKKTKEKKKELAERELMLEDMDFHKACAALPTTAPQADEIDWIRTHPKMVAKYRLSDREKKDGQGIVVTAEDILLSPNGNCPSRGAAYMLQHWVNSPAEFFKSLLSEQKKKTGSEVAPAGETDKVSDSDADNIERMLEELR